MAEHAILSASGSHRWLNCPGSIRMSEGIPSKSSVYAEEGTAAHAIAERCLRTGDDPAIWIGRVVRILPRGETSVLQRGAKPKPGQPEYLVTDEMADAVRVYTQTVIADLAARPSARLRVEHKFDLSPVFPGLFGTNDASVGEPWARLAVYDLKYGAGVPVEVKDNPQLLYYALGAYGLDDYAEIEMVIVQPRARHADGPVRRWLISDVDLAAWRDGVLLPGCHIAADPDAPLNPGDWCKFCPALPVCGAVKEHTQAIVKSSFEPVMLPPPEKLTVAELARVLDGEDLIKKWLSEVSTYAQEKLEAGEPVPGYKLVAKKSNRKWGDAEAAERALTAYVDRFPIYEPQCIRSVSQIEKDMKKAKIDPEKALAGLVEKPDAGVTIAPVSDRRPAVDVTPVKDSFVDVSAPADEEW